MGSIVIYTKALLLWKQLRKTITDALNIKCGKQANHLLPTSNSEQRSIAYLTTINFDIKSSMAFNQTSPWYPVCCSLHANLHAQFTIHEVR